MLIRPRSTSRGFTIVELLIVIVVIAILAAITIVSYNGIARRSEISALQSSLRQTANKLNLIKVDSNDIYPATLPVGMPASGSTYELTYNRNTNVSFCLTAVSKKTTSLVYRINESGAVETGYCPGHSPLDIKILRLPLASVSLQEHTLLLRTTTMKVTTQPTRHVQKS
jgi:prepilin-type N-terminal cleavage/methylation domain-containing protein